MFGFFCRNQNQGIWVWQGKSKQEGLQPRGGTERHSIRIAARYFCHTSKPRKNLFCRFTVRFEPTLLIFT